MGLSIGGMAKWAGGIAGALKGLGALQRVTGWLSWIPGIGAIPGIVSAVLGLVLGAIRRFFEGLTVILSNPVTLVTVGAIAMVATAFGMKLGVEWSDHRVRQAQGEVARVIAERNRAYADASAKAAEADAARRAAEEAEAARDQAVNDAVVRARRATAGRVRSERQSKPSSDGGSGLSWAETIFQRY